MRPSLRRAPCYRCPQFPREEDAPDADQDHDPSQRPLPGGRRLRADRRQRREGRHDRARTAHRAVPLRRLGDQALLRRHPQQGRLQGRGSGGGARRGERRQGRGPPPPGFLRGFPGGAGAAAAGATLGAPRVHAKKKGGAIRFIPHADLKVLDPIATTAYITRNHAYFIYDTLFGTDEHLAIKPQMVDKYASTNKGLKWSFTLRDGLKFHDGAAVTSEDAVESLKRWSKRDPLGRLLAAHTAKLAPADKKTFTLELSEPFGLVLDALGKPSSNVPFIMPARIAAASADEPIKETIGSGPVKFVKDERQPGHQALYVKNPDYGPRQEQARGSTGGKVVNVDRVVWRYIPDHATANAALDAGEVDWWENPPLDFVPKIEANAV